MDRSREQRGGVGGRATKTPVGASALAFSAAEGLEALGTLGVGVAVVSSDWRVVYANRAWLAVFGATWDDSAGRSPDRAFPALVGLGQEEVLRATAADGRARYCRVTPPEQGAADLAGPPSRDVRAIKTRSGGLLLELSPAAVQPRAKDAATEGESDDARTRELAADLDAATRAKRNFLAAISHELRTPLTALAGYGEILGDEVLGAMSKPQLDIVEKMRSVTHHLTVMIDELLSYSTLEAGRETVTLADASAGDLLRATSAVVEPLAREKGITFSVSMPGHPPMMRTDPDKVRQILVNLAGNGVKFTDEGSVELSLESTDGEVRFHVRDTGIGIREEDQARLFQPFGQLDDSLTRRHGGTGLGLYLSSRLSTLLGGRIDFESAPGRGSTFTLILPIQSTAVQ